MSDDTRSLVMTKYQKIPSNLQNIRRHPVTEHKKAPGHLLLQNVRRHQLTHRISEDTNSFTEYQKTPTHSQNIRRHQLTHRISEDTNSFTEYQKTPTHSQNIRRHQLTHRISEDTNSLTEYQKTPTHSQNIRRHQLTHRISEDTNSLTEYQKKPTHSQNIRRHPFTKYQNAPSHLQNIALFFFLRRVHGTTVMLVQLVMALLASGGTVTAITVHPDQHWNGGFQVDLNIPICEEMNGWKIHLNFSQDIDTVEAWRATVTKVNSREFILTNVDYNAVEHPGDTLSLGFQGHASGDIDPDVGISVEGVADCAGVTRATTVSLAPGETRPPPTIPTLHATGTKQPIRINGTRFYIGNERFFLSGANTAWVAYGYDFGTGHQYQYRRDRYLELLDKVSKAGGNSMRTWIHIEGSTSPAFDDNGFVTGLDTDGAFITDFWQYLNDAQERNILIFPTLWNGAVKQNFHPRLQGLIKDTDKLQSYIDNALIPWVKAVKDHPALGGWDIINEMEGFIKPDVTDPEPCFDTTFLQNSGAGWAGATYTAEELLRWISWQVDGIRRADPNALVTAGSWSQRSQSDNWSDKNLYRDECLTKAGGKAKGTLTFYSTHCYDWQRKFGDDAVFKHDASDYGLDKPLVIAEFNQARGAGMTIEEEFNYAYTHGYSGAWSWHANADGSDTDPTDTQMRGIASIRDKNDQTAGGRIAIDLS
ncbi:hypothetical protein BaRGS_00037283, partial [Batillaria attramentaria]